MRYLILDNKINNSVISSKQQYLYDVFKIYMVPFKISDEIIELRSMPLSEYDVLFIQGHNYKVNDYVKTFQDKINEKNIVLVSCYFGNITKLRLKDKNLFHERKKVIVYDGNRFGFNYDITDSELNLYKCKYESLDDKLNQCFERVI